MQVDIAIVGAGHGGAQAAIALRQQGFQGSVALIGAESAPPYERPPLSKDYLAGDKPFERMLIRPPAFWDERAITLVPGCRIDAVDAAARTLHAASGEAIGYRQLIWAAGGAARALPLPGGDLPGVYLLRDRGHADALRAAAATAQRVVIVGGGYIGLEAAAIFAKAGKAVTLLEAQPRVLARVAGEPLSHWFAALHRAHGVDIRTGVEIAAVTGSDRATGVTLADGTEVAADCVVVGIGIEPEVAPLLAAGAAGAAGGVLVDAHCRTSLADIYAIGDCAAHASAFAGGALVRIESVQNAHDMAATAARALTGDPRPYHAVPWFWSNQYDARLQTVGLSLGHDQWVVRGDPASGSFSVIYLKDGAVIALDCVNAVRDYAQGRALVTGAVRADPVRLGDPDVPLKELAAA